MSAGPKVGSADAELLAVCAAHQAALAETDVWGDASAVVPTGCDDPYEDRFNEALERRHGQVIRAIALRALSDEGKAAKALMLLDEIITLGENLEHENEIRLALSLANDMVSPSARVRADTRRGAPPKSKAEGAAASVVSLSTGPRIVVARCARRVQRP